MTPLADHLTRQIAAEGPISIAEYMSLCLLHPELGYYTTGQPFGQHGDFTTAPEISQMFGEMIGLCLAQVWLDLGAPKRALLVELGPGRGTLMADVLRTVRAVPECREALEVHLVEASKRLREQQAQVLSQHEVCWHDTLETLPDDAPMLCIANEFFDALPIRQFQRDEAGWRERMVGLEDGQLSFGLSAPTRLAALEHRMDDTRPGDIVETSRPSQAVAQALGHRIAQQRGTALIFDYGDWRSLGDTLQALKGHRSVPVLSDPGLCDLTAHVDFEALLTDVPCAHSKLTPQGIVLERLGITARAQSLANALSGTALEEHIAAHRRLTHPHEMGSLFKSVALFAKGAQPPPGYET